MTELYLEHALEMTRHVVKPGSEWERKPNSTAKAEKAGTARKGPGKAGDSRSGGACFKCGGAIFFTRKPRPGP